MHPFLTSAPAMIALIIKAGIYLYARSSKTHNYQTRLYLLFLFALSIQNIAEIAHFYVLADGVIPAFEVTVFYAASIVAILLLFHLSIAVSWESRWPALARWVYGLGYVYGFTVLALLVTSDRLIQGFESIAYTVTRIPGPLYYLFEFLVLGLCGLVIVFFLLGALYAETSRKRAQNALLLAAVVPIITIVVAVLTLLHFEIKWLNASVVLPMAITFFLLVSAYAIHQHRIFDIQFFIPGSRVRHRKTQFHDGIRRLIAEIADLPSPGEVVARLSDTLRCPVALLGCSQPAYAGGADRMIEVSAETLRKIDEIVVAQEIVDARPNVYRAMISHEIDAIVPFYPHNSDVAGWLLLGRTFEDNFYSEHDFRIIEQLFGKMSELFLDKFTSLRSELSTMQQGIQALTAENWTLKSLLNQWQKCPRGPVGGASVLYADEPRQDNVIHAVRASCESLPQSVTLLGRDRDTARLLRSEFQDVKTYVGVSSKASQKQGQPEILVCLVDGDCPELARQLHAWKQSTAVLLYGRGAKEFANKYCDTLTGGLFDIADSMHSANFMQRLQALTVLHKHCFSLRNHNLPLIGRSPDFCSYMRTLQLFTEFSDIVLIDHGGDLEQFAESIHYLHGQAKRPGTALVGKAADVANANLDQHHTVAIVDADVDIQTTRRVLPELTKSRDDAARVLLGCRAHANGSGAVLSELEPEVSVFSIKMPKLTERTADIGLLFHYFVLQFNVRSPISLSYGQKDVDAVLTPGAMSSVGALRQAVFERLCDEARRAIRSEAVNPPGETSINLDVDHSKRSLDELVRDFEARIIRQTLIKCAGNKAKTARVLGLRPNTLHYKLQRYGFNESAASRI